MLNFILGLFSKDKERKSGGGLLDFHDGYRTAEQEKAVFYFSDANKKGCFAKKEKGQKSSGCFAKKPGKKKGKGCFAKKPFISDAEYDAIVNSLVQRIDPYHKGLEKLGIDESQVKEIKPIQFSNYKYELGSYWRIGSDGVLRTSLYQVSCIYFSASELFAYQISFSTDWNKVEERTYEYHYKDITSFTSLTEQEDEIKEGEVRPAVKENTFTISVPGDGFKVSLCNKSKEAEENSIQAMKAMLREKKA
ncbi:MAG: hypothetical protein Ta2G_17720 [Termitinemataceae bacterium]|nr:MAG: hypothetical protein Ta2G_17720 [Termitinemataceae bacterium]